VAGSDYKSVSGTSFTSKKTTLTPRKDDHERDEIDDSLANLQNMKKGKTSWELDKMLED
jgi:hypothetical protein